MEHFSSANSLGGCSNHSGDGAEFVELAADGTVAVDFIPGMLPLSHLSSESPAAVNPSEITASSSSFYAGTFPTVLTLQKRE